MFQKATILRKLEKIMMAITFAEANLRDIALSFLKEDKKRHETKQTKKRIEKQDKREELRL